ncbi:MAG: YHS domain-containing protein [Magnetovibrio sp.]|nr:YHS domain-containing protein [Magnetovibrio sp.]
MTYAFRYIFIVMFGLTVAMVSPALADKDMIYTSTFSNTAVSGYDPVAYFTEGRPVKGKGDFEYEWNGVTWKFSTQANLDMFKSSPEAYAPQFGGYCAWAVSQGYTASTDPEAWTIVGDKLYLNYSKDVRAMWLGDVPGNIAKGNVNWPNVLKK